MPERDFSVVPVLVLHQEKVSLHRAVRSAAAATRASDVVEVEFGARWETIAGQKQRVDGTWHKCRIVRVVHSELHVELLEPLRQERD